jgi:uncharacterized protein (TIGR00299 family) protein
MMTARTAYLDCSTGVSGDKFLGALIDVGEQLAASGEAGFTTADVRALVVRLAPEARVDVEHVTSYGVAAVSVRVEAETAPPTRTWADVRALIERVDLSEPVRRHAMLAFEELARAEARAHGVAPEDVHFHEVGAIDSIVDILGVCAGLHALGIERLIVSPVALGSGTVETSHGTLDVPAPATAALLRDAWTVAGPTCEGGAPIGELTTPTGAALLRAYSAGYSSVPPASGNLIGRGAGTRDIGAPNVCRLSVEHTPHAWTSHGPTPDLELEAVVVLETNVDHLPAEALSFAAENLLNSGALDVWQTPIVMKKGRAAVTLSVLAMPADEQRLAKRIVELTGSLGVRRDACDRYVAPRDVREITTLFGPARVKVGGGRIRPEHEDVARIASEHGLAYDDVAREIARLAEDAVNGAL